MASEIEKLTIALEANIRKYEREMARANALAKQALDKVDQQTSRFEKSIESRFQNIAKTMTRGIAGAFAAIGAGVSLNELRKAADDYTKIINTLNVAGVKDSDLPQTMDALYESAQRNAVPLDALATLYGRVSQAQTTLKATSGDLLGLTDIVAQSLRVSGTSATEASGALLQLGQALSGGKIQAEEYNSLIDGMYPLLQAAAAGIKEAGGDVSKLTALVKDGKVSSEAFFRGIQAGAPVLTQKLAGATLTTGQAMTRLRNEFTLAVGAFDKAVGVTPALASGLNSVASSMRGIGEAATTAALGVKGLITRLEEALEKNAALHRQQALTYQNERGARTAEARDMGTANAGGRGAIVSEADTARRRAMAGFRASEIDYANRLMTAPLPPTRPGDAGAKINPISLANYVVPGGSGGGGGSGSGGSSREKLDAFDRELRQYAERKAALEKEAETVGKGALAVERSRAAVELENAAKRASLPITDDLRKKIDEAAEGYAKAKIRVDEVTEALRSAQEAQKYFADAAADAFEDLIINAETADEVVKNLIKSLAKAALKGVLTGSGPLAGMLGTAGKDGATGGLFGLLSAGLGSLIPGRAGGGPVRSGQPYVVGEKRPELFVPGQSGTIVPRVPSVAGVAAARGSSVPQRMTVAVNVDGARGNAEIVQMVQMGVTAGVKALSDNIDRTIVGRLTNAQFRNLV